MSFHLISEVFWLRIRKVLQLEKGKHLMKEQSFWKKARFNLSKRQLLQDWRAQNNPVVAGCFVFPALET